MRVRQLLDECAAYDMRILINVDDLLICDAGQRSVWYAARSSTCSRCSLKTTAAQSWLKFLTSDPRIIGDASMANVENWARYSATDWPPLQFSIMSMSLYAPLLVRLSNLPATTAMRRL